MSPVSQKLSELWQFSWGQGKTKSCYLKIFKSQYLVKFFRYGPNFLHVFIALTGLKITFCNIRSHGAPCLISRGGSLAPPPGF